ncbi:hypothetical protein J6590_010682 [Homalodisca vitripennis]|nr:hypothetical protein J6590_010682 [Homalodisca vitripennis]
MSKELKSRAVRSILGATYPVRSSYESINRNYSPLKQSISVSSLTRRAEESCCTFYPWRHLSSVRTGYKPVVSFVGNLFEVFKMQKFVADSTAPNFADIHPHHRQPQCHCQLEC